MSTVDSDASHVQTDQASFGAVLAKGVAMFSTAGDVVGGAISAYEFLELLMDEDPVQEELDEILADLKRLITHEDLDELGELANTQIKPHAVEMDTAWPAMQTYTTSETVDTRDALRANIVDAGGLHAALLALLAGYQARFIPGAYRTNGAIPGWVNGRFTDFRACWGVNGPRELVPFQVYCQFQDGEDLRLYDEPPFALLEEWSVSEPLHQNALRWDGALSLPLIFEGLDMWAAALTQLEPFYRLTGGMAEYVHEVADAMDGFEGSWTRALLWTREMPSKEEFDAMGFGELPEPIEYGDPTRGYGFTRWPLGVLDPITGVERRNLSWWKADKPELWTADQRAEFLNQRAGAVEQLKSDCGLATFSLRKGTVRNLLMPPPHSPSLQPHPELLQTKYTSLASGGSLAMPPPVVEVQYDEFSRSYPGRVLRSSITATAPISVQSNPSPAPPHARRAMSDVEFGYKLTITPTGGTPHTYDEWIWPVRLDLNDAVRSLYHDAEGSRRDPYWTSTQFSVPADTWETITDGTNVKKQNVRRETVTFTMTVGVVDMAPSEEMDPTLIPGDNLLHRGAMWIKIDASRGDNQSRSFELTVEITETAAVDPKGHRPRVEKNLFSDYMKYRRTLRIPVDICRIIVPSDFFPNVSNVNKQFRDSSDKLGIVGPHPDPDPILELSLWRVLLEHDAVLLQDCVHRLRESTVRPSLTAPQTLAYIDRLIAEPAAPRHASMRDTSVSLRNGGQRPRLTRFEVRAARGGGWQTFQEGETVAAAPTKEAAVRDAVALAKEQEAASVVIKGRDGRIQEERTYPRRADPRRTRG